MYFYKLQKCGKNKQMPVSDYLLTVVCPHTGLYQVIIGSVKDHYTETRTFHRASIL